MISAGIFTGAGQTSDRIALVASLRGTSATAVAFLLLPRLGHPAAAMFATIAGLNTSIADSGGRSPTANAVSVVASDLMLEDILAHITGMIE